MGKLRNILAIVCVASTLGGCTSVPRKPSDADKELLSHEIPRGALKDPPTAKSGKSSVDATDDTSGSRSEFAGTPGRVIQVAGQEAGPAIPPTMGPMPEPLPMKSVGPSNAPPPVVAEVPAPIKPLGPVNPANVPPGSLPPTFGPTNVGQTKPGPDLIIPGHKKAGAETIPFDPHCRTSPTAAGCRLDLGPTESAVERAVELSKQLEAAEAEKRALAVRLRGMEKLVESREKMLREDEAQLIGATEDLIQARNELKKARTDLDRVKQRLDSVEKEDLETLRLVVEALRKFLEERP